MLMKTNIILAHLLNVSSGKQNKGNTFSYTTKVPDMFSFLLNTFLKKKEDKKIKQRKMNENTRARVASLAAKLRR